MIVYLASVGVDTNHAMFCAAIAKDINLTHCNQLVIEAISLYGIAVKSLLNSGAMTSTNEKALVAFASVKELAT